jgi:uncharacterized RDD family membrane protein YckC
MTEGFPVATLPGGRARRRVQVHTTRAPFSLRCGALLIDYIVLMAIVAACTLFARMMGGGARSAGNSTETVGWVLVIVLALLNYIVLSGWRGQTIGKWTTGLRIERADGQPLSFGRACLRHLLGYPVSMILGGLGFLLATVTPRSRALHDYIAGTVVVRDEVVVLDK